MFYTYKLKWNSTGMWYYGVRYSDGAMPEDLMKTYFTSSKNAQKYIKANGLPDVAKITKIFNNKEDAINWENKFLCRTKAHLNEMSLNLTNNKAIHPYHASKHSKGKTYDEIYGTEKAENLRKMRSESNKQRKRTPWSDEARSNISQNNLGNKNPNAKIIKCIFNNTVIIEDCLKNLCIELSKKHDIRWQTLNALIGKTLRQNNKKISTGSKYYDHLKEYTFVSLSGPQ